MAKYCIDKYPMGSFPYQQSPGRYLHEILYENLRLLAKHIVDDMTFLGIIFSSTYEVGTGKSTLAQHIGECYQDILKQEHGIANEFKIDNLVFTPFDLIERAFQVPKYSCVIVDEWEDAHYWSELGMTLREFFRKCRQLNLFILLIIPNFFQLPPSYALSRSFFAIDVYFTGEFERGNFKFYGFDKKKDLYIKGKKTQDYKVVAPDFLGGFTKGYVVDKKEYEARKMADLERHAVKKDGPRASRDEKAVAILANLLVKGFGCTYPDLEKLTNIPDSTLKDRVGRYVSLLGSPPSETMLPKTKENAKVVLRAFAPRVIEKEVPNG